MKIKPLKLIISILICEFAGLIGSIFTSSSIPTWYGSLTKSSINPPNWVFAPVWTTLFLLMGVSLYLILESKQKTKKAMTLFSIQLFLNILWSIIFFGFRSPFFALIEIFFLWIAIFLTTIEFYKISKISAYLLIPYLLWVSFAILLNYSIFILN
jgi:benzodiazapine receptor